jgi:hypothetical protein
MSFKPIDENKNYTSSVVSLQQTSTPLIMKPLDGCVIVLKVKYSLSDAYTSRPRVDKNKNSCSSTSIDLQQKVDNLQSQHNVRGCTFLVHRLVHFRVDTASGIQIRGKENDSEHQICRVLQNMMPNIALHSWLSDPHSMMASEGSLLVDSVQNDIDSLIFDRDAHFNVQCWLTTKESWYDKPFGWLAGPMSVGLVTATPSIASQNPISKKWTVNWIVNVGPITGAIAKGEGRPCC